MRLLLYSSFIRKWTAQNVRIKTEILCFRDVGTHIGKYNLQDPVTDINTLTPIAVLLLFEIFIYTYYVFIAE